MARRRLLRIALALFLLAAGLFIVYSIYDSCPIRYANANKIIAGMTRTQVEELLGCPPGDYSTGPLEHRVLDGGGKFVRWNDFQFLGAEGRSWDATAPSDAPGIGRFWHCAWRGDRGEIVVRFHPDTMLAVDTDLEYATARRIPPAYWRRIEEFFGWR